MPSKASKSKTSSETSSFSLLRKRLWTLDKLWLPTYKHRVVVKPTWSERPTKGEILEVRVRHVSDDSDWDELLPLSYAQRDILKEVNQIDLSGLEYYIHYGIECKRVDEWVGYDRILKDRGPNMDWLKKPKSHVNGLLKGLGDSSRSSENSGGGLSRSKSRNLIKRKHHNISDKDALNSADKGSDDDKSEHEIEIKNITSVCLGRFEIDAWYYSPYNFSCDKLYICEYCLKNYKKAHTLQNHLMESGCNNYRLPGKAIYHDDNLVMYEVDGREQKLFCQNLCLLCRLFLDHKTCYYDVDAFYFYILCEVDEFGSHIVGFFSKQKQSTCDYNVACILVLPPFQKKGYGKLLISMSYELTMREGKTGSPEKPLSDLGKRSYLSYWNFKICQYFSSEPSAVSLFDIGRRTGIAYDDIIESLVDLDFINENKDGGIVLRVPPQRVKEVLQQGENIKIREVDPAKLEWSAPLHSYSRQISRSSSTSSHSGLLGQGQSDLQDKRGRA